MVVQYIVFLTLSTLICRSTDISKCFSESLGIRDNGSRLYIDKDDFKVQRLTAEGVSLFENPVPVQTGQTVMLCTLQNVIL